MGLLHYSCLRHDRGTQQAGAKAGKWKTQNELWRAPWVAAAGAL